ncbi:DUF3857 domain-containing protein [Flavobacterium tegetincola]|uniref:DUF3857 domain-containing protein n=1 Tax=Flavobacterium tegetincola TaxID=150172 RepID=UPI0003F4D0D5|nr:DUF3857 domain-containing protein [Flavobacterium tegetincola]
MKKLLPCLLLLLCSFSYAQNKAEIKEFFWGKNDDHKNTIAVPVKWKGESAVIIFKKDYYNFHKFGKSVTYTSAVRKRIKLQDANAVQQFSEFSFAERFYTTKGFSFKRGTTTVGIKIVKAGGTEIEVDVDKEAKDIDDTKKIAIANLEVGDIIDFYYYTVEPFKSFYETGFAPVETTLGDIYPTMEMKLLFETENDFFINFNTYNGAPELKEVYNKGGDRKYELVAKDIEKNEFPIWFYPAAELPFYKFQVYFARSARFEAGAEAFLSEKESIIKKTVSKDDVFNYYNNKFKPYGDISEINAFVKSKTFASDEEKVRQVYYYTRHVYFTKYVEAFVAHETNIFYPFELYQNPVFIKNEEQFINHFMNFLKKNEINYDIIIGTARFNGPIKDLLIQNNVTLLLKVNTKNPIYLEFFSPFSSADQFNYNLENTEAYALQVSKGKKVVDAENIVLPKTTSADNVSKTTTTIALESNLTDLKINRVSSFFGHFKESEQSDKLEFYDYVNEDYAKYGTTPLMELVRNKKKKEQYQKEFAALIDKVKQRKEEELKKIVSQEFEFEIDDVDYEVKNTGRYGSNQPFSFEEKFVIKNNLVKKAGDNYIIEIGKFLTNQIDVDKKQKDRVNNVYMTFPRLFDNEFIFEIPAGYTVIGIEKLNKKVENETGKFIRTAAISGNQLNIKTVKEYKNYFEPNSNWAKMVSFLDAAYQFTQEKILLKKN